MTNKYGKLIRLTHIDGKLPNLALMRLSAWHKSQTHTVVFSRGVSPDLFEPASYDRIYASSIFALSYRRQQAMIRQWPDAIVGGTGFNLNGFAGPRDLGEVGIPDDFNRLDYTLYPGFRPSIGFSQRGCRLKCKFCVVPDKEGRNRSTTRIEDIWRGPRHPRHIHLLDNDFFGQPDWQSRSEEIIEGGFKVCFSQGINIRLFNARQAGILAQMDYRDTRFNRQRIYTAWDNLKDEERFFRGIDMLTDAGIRPDHIMAYMLIGYRAGETEDEIIYRVERMRQVGILPYPMVYTAPGHTPDRHLKRIQRWVVRGIYHAMSFKAFCNARPQGEKPADMMAESLYDELAGTLMFPSPSNHTISHEEG